MSVCSTGRVKATRFLAANRSRLRRFPGSPGYQFVQADLRDDGTNIDSLVERRPDAQRAHAGLYFARELFRDGFPASKDANRRNRPVLDLTRSRRRVPRRRYRDRRLQK